MGVTAMAIAMVFDCCPGGARSQYRARAAFA
jgi:hypothetical protein